jgi:Protein of unknown function (DUF2878)
MMALRVGAMAPGRARRLGLVAAFVAFELAWLACVLGAAHGWPWAGVALAMIVIALSVALGAKPRVDAALVAAALFIGFIWDSSMAQLGWIAYAEPGPVPGIAPVWILALWALLAIVLREPLRWLHARLPLAALLGALGGPLSYAAAQRLGACRLVEPTVAGLALALGWAAITPLLLVLARRWDARPTGAVR